MPYPLAWELSFPGNGQYRAAVVQGDGTIYVSGYWFDYSYTAVRPALFINLCAITDKKLSSKTGFKGLFRKVLIFIMVGVANIIDTNVMGQAGVLRTLMIFFYLSNEGISLFENAAHLGLPVPTKLKEILCRCYFNLS